MRESPSGCQLWSTSHGREDGPLAGAARPSRALNPSRTGRRRFVSIYSQSPTTENNHQQPDPWTRNTVVQRIHTKAACFVETNLWFRDEWSHDSSQVRFLVPELGPVCRRRAERDRWIHDDLGLLARLVLHHTYTTKPECADSPSSSHKNKRSDKREKLRNSQTQQESTLIKPVKPFSPGTSISSGRQKVELVRKSIRLTEKRA